MEAAERDDERKASWDNVSAAAALAAQRKVQEDKLDTHSRDQFLLAAIQKPTSVRTKFQRVLYEGATARKDAEEDERSRWLHILAGIILNTDTPMAKMREKPGNAQLLGAGKLASTLRARVRSLRRYTLWLSRARGVSFPSETAHLVHYLWVRSQEPTIRGGLEAAHQAMRFCEEITAVPEQARLTESTVYSLAKKESSPRPCPESFRGSHRGSLQLFWQRWKKRSATLLPHCIIGSTVGGSLCSVGELYGSLITVASARQTPISTAKVSLGS